MTKVTPPIFFYHPVLSLVNYFPGDSVMPEIIFQGGKVTSGEICPVRDVVRGWKELELIEVRVKHPLEGGAVGR